MNSANFPRNELKHSLSAFLMNSCITKCRRARFTMHVRIPPSRGAILLSISQMIARYRRPGNPMHNARKIAVSCTKPPSFAIYCFTISGQFIIKTVWYVWRCCWRPGLIRANYSREFCYKYLHDLNNIKGTYLFYLNVVF